MEPNKMGLKDLYSNAYDEYYYPNPEPVVDVGGVIGQVSSQTINPEEVTKGGYAALRGVVDSELALFGELEGLYNGIKNIAQNPESKKWFDAFIDGMEKNTNLPRLEEVKKFLNQYLPEVSPDFIVDETVGQLVAPGAAIKYGMDAAKAAKGAIIVAPAVSVTAKKDKGLKQ
jgi:hypothetical protein